MQLELKCPGHGSRDGVCSGKGTCEDSTGKCVCNEGFKGENCKGMKKFQLTDLTSCVKILYTIVMTVVEFFSESGKIQ